MRTTNTWCSKTWRRPNKLCWIIWSRNNDFCKECTSGVSVDFAIPVLVCATVIVIACYILSEKLKLCQNCIWQRLRCRCLLLVISYKLVNGYIKKKVITASDWNRKPPQILRFSFVFFPSADRVGILILTHLHLLASLWTRSLKSCGYIFMIF